MPAMRSGSQGKSRGTASSFMSLLCTEEGKAHSAMCPCDFGNLTDVIVSNGRHERRLRFKNNTSVFNSTKINEISVLDLIFKVSDFIECFIFYVTELSGINFSNLILPYIFTSSVS